MTRIATPYGGLLYFEGVGEHASIHANVQGVMRCPWFDSTLMQDQDWPLLRNNPAPWMDLVGRHVIISMPSTCARQMDYPRAVIDYWDAVVVNHCDLVFQQPPHRKERIVADVQISAGYMHSGYPVCFWLGGADLKGLGTCVF